MWILYSYPYLGNVDLFMDIKINTEAASRIFFKIVFSLLLPNVKSQMLFHIQTKTKQFNGIKFKECKNVFEFSTIQQLVTIITS